MHLSPGSSLGRAVGSMLGDRWRWWATFVVLVLLTGLWSLATPLMASPDEPAHTVKAAAVVRGELYGTPARPTRAGISPFVRVRVPEVFADTNELPGCYATKQYVAASCAPGLRPRTKTVTVETPAGRYEPLYYLVVGLPSLLWRSSAGVRLMRLVSALVCSAFLASAFESARTRRSRYAVLGVAAACTPMVVLLAGTVNPSTLEIAAAVCLWSSGLAVVLDDGPGVAHGRLVTRMGLSACVLVQVRSLSLLWTALVGLALLAVARRERLVELIRRTDVRVWGALFAASTVFALVWLFAFHPLTQIPTPPPHARPATAVLASSVGKFDVVVREMIGVAGWTDVFPPAPTFYGWLVVVAVLLGLGLARARIRLMAVTAAVVLGTAIIPVVLEASQAARIGYVWQGRYTLPLAVGIPVLAAMAVPEDLAQRIGERVPVALAVVVVVAQAAMFVVALRRYSVGIYGPLDFFSGPWQPPLGAALVTALFGLGLLGYGLLVGLPPRHGAPRSER